MAIEGKIYTFYRKTSFGISTWSIWFEGQVIYYGYCAQEGGAMNVTSEKVSTNQSGRAIKQQIDLQMESRLSRMMDKGYKVSREEALLGSTNQLGLLNPMLAHPIERLTLPSFTQAHVQIKYNGHRCLITRQDGEMFAYTRKGKAIKTISHILNKLDPVFPEGVTIDGELYIHGLKLQAISSLIKRLQPGCENLVYHSYDIIENLPFVERWDILSKMLNPINDQSVYAVPTFTVNSLEEAYTYYDSFRAQGYEGAMLRLSTAGYEDGKRSSQLIKIKGSLDDTFTVVGVKEGKHGIGILTLKLNISDAVFDCTAPGSVPQKQQILADKDRYIGKRVRVTYAELTDDNIPFHCVAEEFVEEL